MHLPGGGSSSSSDLQDRRYNKYRPSCTAHSLRPSKPPFASQGPESEFSPPAEVAEGDWMLAQVKEVKGAVTAVTSLAGMVVASVGRRMTIYGWRGRQLDSLAMLEIPLLTLSLSTVSWPSL